MFDGAWSNLPFCKTQFFSFGHMQNGSGSNRICTMVCASVIYFASLTYLSGCASLQIYYFGDQVHYYFTDIAEGVLSLKDAITLTKEMLIKIKELRCHVTLSAMQNCQHC